MSSAALADAAPVSTAPTNKRLADLPNMRDLNEAFAPIQAGKLFRCAAPVDATQDDVDFLLRDLRLTELIDLRADEEQTTDAKSLLFANMPLVRYTRSSWTAKIDKEVVSGSWTVPGRVRHHISLLDRRRYILGLLQKVPLATSVPALLTGIFDFPRSRGMLLEEINKGGLDLLYEVVLDSSRYEFAAALRVITAAAEAGRPLAFFCKAGKDRTGLLAMMVLSCCGAGEEAIIEDYHRSDSYRLMALAGLEDRPELAKLDRAKFEVAPREAMAATLRYLHARYGGPTAYLHTLGFTYDEQRRLKAVLLQQQARPGTIKSKL